MAASLPPAHTRPRRPGARCPEHARAFGGNRHSRHAPNSLRPSIGSWCTDGAFDGQVEAASAHGALAFRCRSACSVERTASSEKRGSSCRSFVLGALLPAGARSHGSEVTARAGFACDSPIPCRAHHAQSRLSRRVPIPTLHGACCLGNKQANQAEVLANKQGQVCRERCGQQLE